MLKIIGLGPDTLEHASCAALAALRSGAGVYLRTGRHPAADELKEQGVAFETFDHLYEAAETFEEVYGKIAETLIAEANAGDVVYAVPGHPLMGERSVEMVVEKAAALGVQLKIEGSMSFVESCLEALAVSIGRGLLVLDALEIESLSPTPSLPNLIYQVYSRDIASSVKLRLMEFYPDEFEVWVVTGTVGEPEVEKMPLYMLDRREYNHLASVFVPEA